MAESGDGNIKVVVRCRPLNSRGTPHPHIPLDVSHFPLLSLSSPPHPSCEPIMQNLEGAPNHSSACRATRHSWTPQSLAQPRIQSVLPNEKQWPLVLTRAIGLLGLATNRATVHSRHCTTTSERNCWTMGLLGLTLVFWLVSLAISSSVVLKT